MGSFINSYTVILVYYTIILLAGSSEGVYQGDGTENTEGKPNIIIILADDMVFRAHNSLFLIVVMNSTKNIVFPLGIQ